MLPAMIAFAALFVPWLLAAPLPGSPGLAQLLAQTPADSLLGPLRRYELQRRHGAPAAEAAMTLGHLHLVRGEYRLAADAFTRAAAGFEPARKDEALYWGGIAWLGVPDRGRARALLDQVTFDAAARRDEATLGIALSLIEDNRPDRALKFLGRLTGAHTGECTAAALGATAAAAERTGDAGLAKRARDRLAREFPRSLEAQGVGPEGESARARAGP
jgi:tetratricopeptide (TPR) repeat protein